MTIPIYATIVGALLIILQAFLMVAVGSHRVKSGVNLGLGDDPSLERKIRRHGNLAENAALFVVVLALAEMTFVPITVIKIIALVFVIARFSHAIALSTEAGAQGTAGGKIFVAMRVIGAMGTLISFLALGGFILYGLL